MRFGVAAAALFGVAVAVVALTLVGLRPVLTAVAAIGGGGFLVFCALTLAVIPVLGAGWRAVTPRGPGGSLGALSWARLLRDAAADVLPFSQVGGLLIGAREATARGLAPSLTFATMILDLTCELVAQLVFTLCGVGALVWRASQGDRDDAAVWIGGGGLLIAMAGAASFVLAQRRGVQGVRFLAGRWFPRTIARAAEVQAQTLALYGRRRALVASVALHLAAWTLSGLGAWAALRFMGARIGPIEALAVESLLYAVKSFAFVVPGAVGVQEGAYALIGPIFGLPAELALALSLIKRARDLVLGAPVLLIWQVLEGGRLIEKRAASR